MAHSKTLEAYPNEEYALVCEKTSRGERVNIPCDAKLALTIRHNFYAWRRAVEADPEHAARLGVDARKVRSAGAVPSATGLLFIPAGELPINRILRPALGLGVKVETTSDADESLKRLQDLIKGAKDGE